MVFVVKESTENAFLMHCKRNTLCWGLTLL